MMALDGSWKNRPYDTMDAVKTTVYDHELMALSLGASS